MKKLFNSAAAGLLATAIMTGPSLAGAVPLSANNQPITVTPAMTQELSQGCTFYANLLHLTDKMHFAGPTKISQQDIAAGAYEGMIKAAHDKANFDPKTNKVDNTDAMFKDLKKKEHIVSAKIGGQTFTVEKPTTPMTTYEDECTFLGDKAVELSTASGMDIFTLYEHALNGALHASRDPHTSLIMMNTGVNPNRHAGDVGVGLTPEIKNGAVIVKDLIEGPLGYQNNAQKAGIQAGDEIIAIDGASVSGKTQEEVQEMIQGKPGSDVTFTVKRNGQSQTDIKVMRAQVQRAEIHGKMLNDNTAMIRIDSFMQEQNLMSLSDEFKAVIENVIQDAAKQGKGIDNIIIDLRNNGGGLLDQVKIMADLFLDAKPGEPNIIVAHDKNAGVNRTYMDTQASESFTGANVILLQNQGSASASEIMAGAFKDAGIEIVGKTSFGKGTVQQMSTVNKNGIFGGRPAVGYFKVTIEAFFPGNSGKSNQHSGIIPNVKVIFNDIRDDIAKNAKREKDLGRSMVPVSKTRAGTLPDFTCTLKKQYSGELSQQLLSTVPQQYVTDVKVKDDKTGTVDTKKMLDADLLCAMKRFQDKAVTPPAQDKYPYVEIAPYKAPKP